MNNTTSYDDDTWVHTTLNISSTILFTIGFPSNLIIIYLVSKHQHLKNATNYFVSSLAIADLFVLVSMLFWIISIKVLPNPVGTEMKYIYSSLDLTTGILSMLNVFCVSADRAIAVTYPLRYERIVTKRRSLCITVTIMCYSLCLLVLGIARYSNPSLPDGDSKIQEIDTYHQIVDYICYVNFFLAILGTIICYTLIFLIVFHKLKGSRKLERLMSNTRHAFNDESSDQEVNQEKKRSRSILFREMKVTGNIMIIVFPFTAGWTFFIGTHFYEDTYGTYVESITYNLFMIIVPWLLSVLNPVIYLVVNRQLRQTFCKTLQNLTKGRERPFLDESRLSILASLSRRASSTRTSSTVDGSELINVPLRNIRKSQMMTNSARSSTSMERCAFEATPLSS